MQIAHVRARAMAERLTENALDTLTDAVAHLAGACDQGGRRTKLPSRLYEASPRRVWLERKGVPTARPFATRLGQDLRAVSWVRHCTELRMHRRMQRRSMCACVWRELLLSAERVCVGARQIRMPTEDGRGGIGSGACTSFASCLVLWLLLMSAINQLIFARSQI